MKETIMNATTSTLSGSHEGMGKCQKFQRSMARPQTFTPGLTKDSLSRYANELFRRLEQGQPLTLAEYAHAEDILAAQPPRPMASTKPIEGMPRYGTLIGSLQPTEVTSAGIR